MYSCCAVSMVGDGPGEISCELRVANGDAVRRIRASPVVNAKVVAEGLDGVPPMAVEVGAMALAWDPVAVLTPRVAESVRGRALGAALGVAAHRLDDVAGAQAGAAGSVDAHGGRGRGHDGPSRAHVHDLAPVLGIANVPKVRARGQTALIDQGRGDPRMIARVLDRGHRGLQGTVGRATQHVPRLQKLPRHQSAMVLSLQELWTLKSRKLGRFQGLAQHLQQVWIPGQTALLQQQRLWPQWRLRHVWQRTFRAFRRA